MKSLLPLRRNFIGRHRVTLTCPPPPQPCPRAKLLISVPIKNQFQSGNFVLLQDLEQELPDSGAFLFDTDDNDDDDDRHLPTNDLSENCLVFRWPSVCFASMMAGLPRRIVKVIWLLRFGLFPVVGAVPRCLGASLVHG